MRIVALSTPLNASPTTAAIAQGENRPMVTASCL